MLSISDQYLVCSAGFISLSGFKGNGSSTVLVINRSDDDDGRDLFEYFRDDITRPRREDLVALVFVEFLVIIFLIGSISINYY